MKKYGQRFIYPATRTTEAGGNYEGKVIFKHVQIRLVASNEPLMGCGPLPDWLRDSRCIFAVDTFDDNLCIWRCLTICKRHACGKKNRMKERNCKAALNQVHEYYGDNKLKRKDVRPTKHVDFEGIARHCNVNIVLHEPNKDKGKDAGSIWRLVYSKIQHKNDLPIINMGILGDHFFTSRRWMCFVRDGNVKDVNRYLRKTRT